MPGRRKYGYSVAGILALIGITVVGGISYFSNPSVFQETTTHEKELIGKEIATPANPVVNYNKLYFKADGNLYALDDLGSEVNLGGATGLSFIRDADGDTLVEVEQSADEDIVRFTAAGVEEAILEPTGLTVTNDVAADTATIGGGYGSAGFSADTDGNIEANGDATVDGDVAAGGGYGSPGVTLDNTSGDVSADGDLIADGSATLGGGAGSGGTTINGGDVETDGDLIAYGDVSGATATIGGGAGATGVSIDTNGNTEIDGTLEVNDTLELASGTTVNELSIDGTLAGDSDDAVPTEKAVKLYVDTEIGAIPEDASADTHVFYVSKAGNDTTGEGTRRLSYLTISKALAIIGDAADATEYKAAATSRYKIYVGPGQYTEALTIPQRLMITIALEDSEIIGNVAYNPDTTLGGATHEPRLIFASNDLKSVDSDTAIPRTGVTGNVEHAASGTDGSHLELNSVGISGILTIGRFFGSNTKHHVHARGSNILGSLQSVNPNAGTVELSHCEVGGMVGDFDSTKLVDVTFTGIIDTNGVTPDGAGIWEDVQFFAGANVFTGMTSAITSDSKSYCSYQDNVPAKGSETFTLSDCAEGVNYDATTPGDWTAFTTEPTITEDALDKLAAKATAEDLWDRSGTTLEPQTANDNLDMGSGDIAGATATIGGGAGATGVSIDADGNTEIDGTLEVNDNLELASGTTVNELSIDGTLAGDSDDAVPTEKAVKLYVDTEIGAIPEDASADTHVFYVSKAGNDTTGEGTRRLSYLTLQKALDMIGDAADTAEYEAAATQRYKVKVGPGVYTETISIPQRLIILIELNGAEFIGDWTYDPDTALGGSSHTPKLIISSPDLRGVHSSTTVSRIGITGDFTFSATTNAISHLILNGVGVSGDIDVGASSTGHQLWTFNTNVVGSIDVAAGGRVNAYMTNAISSSSASVGGATGDFRMEKLQNIRFVGIVDANGQAPGGSWEWHGVEFESGHAHDFTGTTATILTDSTSFCSYSDNVPTKGSEVVTLSDCASGINYDATTAGDWTSFTTEPTEAGDALDKLAAKATAEDLWDRSGTTLEPQTANDNLDMGSGTITTTGDILGGGLGVLDTAAAQTDIFFENNNVVDQNVKLTLRNGSGVGEDVWFWNKNGFGHIGVSADANGIINFNPGSSDNSLTFSSSTINLNADGSNVDLAYDTDTIDDFFFIDAGTNELKIDGGYGSGGFTFDSSGNFSMAGKLTVDGLIDPTGLILEEQSSNPWTPEAGKAALWVKDDAPNVLKYTNDAGTTSNFSALPSNVVIVNSVSDIPAAADLADGLGTVHHLEAKAYIIGADISISSPLAFTTSAGASTDLRAMTTATITYTGADAMIKGNSATGSLYTNRLNFVNTNAAAEFLNITAAEQVLLEWSTFSGGNLGSVAEAESFFMRNMTFTDFDGRLTLDDIDIVYCSALAFVSAVDVDGFIGFEDAFVSVVFNDVQSIGHQDDFLFDIASDFVGRFDANTINIVSGGAFDPTGLDQTDAQVRVHASSNIPDSKIYGGMYVRSNASQTTITEVGLTLAFTAIADAGGGQLTLTMADTTGLSNGQTVWLPNTAYAGTYTLANVIVNTSVEITATFGATAAGDLHTGWVKVVGTSVANDKNELARMTGDNTIEFDNIETETLKCQVAYTAESSSASTSAFEFCVMVDGDISDDSIVERDMINTTVAGPILGTISVVDGATVSIYVRNMTIATRHPIFKTWSLLAE